jgi:hypothetical protein
MATLLSLSIIGLLAVAALLWCLAGFSRALKEQPRVVGLLVRVRNSDTSTTKRRKPIIIPFPNHPSLPQRAGSTRFRRYNSLNLLILAGSAMLFASLGAGFHFMGAV